jgi:hypothetical protein
MCTFGTGSSAVSGEGEHSTNTLKNCAKTAAKINVQQASECDEFQRVCSGYLELYTNRVRPPKRASMRYAPLDVTRTTLAPSREVGPAGSATRREGRILWELLRLMVFISPSCSRAPYSTEGRTWQNSLR